MIREWKYSAPQVNTRADLRLLDISFPQEFYTTIEILFERQQSTNWIPKGYRYCTAGGECDEYFFLGGSYMAANGSDGVYPHPHK